MDYKDYLTIFLISVLIFIVYFALNNIVRTLNKNLINIQNEINKHLISSQSTVLAVTKNLTELEHSTEKILEIGLNIQSLQDVLKPPKLRGELGELLLENALSQILPKNFYQTPYRFSTGESVDAVVKLKDSKLLCIDAKFPLDSIKNHLANGNKIISETPTQFIRDVKKHIDSISAKYILPSEGTLDIALMYIPAENIYYEILLNEEKLLNYAREKHVVPVSPITLYSYISTILIGLKGMEIEKNAQHVSRQLSELKIGLSNFSSEFNTLGIHLNNAKSKYDSAKELVSDFARKLNNVEIKNNDK